MASFRNSPAIHHRSLVLNPSSQVMQQIQNPCIFLSSLCLLLNKVEKNRLPLCLFVWWNIIVDFCRALCSTLALEEARVSSSKQSRRRQQQQNCPHTVECITFAFQDEGIFVFCFLVVHEEEGEVAVMMIHVPCICQSRPSIMWPLQWGLGMPMGQVERVAWLCQFQFWLP